MSNSVLTIKPNCLDDFVAIVADGDRAIGEGRAVDTAAAQHLVEMFLVGAVISDRGLGVLKPDGR